MDGNRKYRKLDGALVRFQSALFFDVRDLIYGTMAFIDWQNKPPLRVDYSMSKSELALRFLDYWGGQPAVMWFVQVLVETLEISVNDLDQLDLSALTDDTKRLFSTQYDVNVPEGI